MVERNAESAISVLDSSDLSERSLDDLTSIAVNEHGQVGAALGDALLHAIRAGEALLQARRRVSDGSWTRYVRETVGMSEGVARTYMRLAHHKEAILAAGVKSKNAALPYLRGLPATGTSGVGGFNRKPEEMRREAVRLRKEGLTFREVGELFGVTPSAVHAWVDPKRAAAMKRNYKERYRRQRQARQALRRQERDEEIRNRGGNVAEAYSLLRRCLQQLDKAATESDDLDEKVSLQEAVRFGHRAEDEIAKALKLPTWKRKKGTEPA